MDDNEYPTENDRRPHLAIERHLTVGAHAYQLTASGTGDERIDLTVVGWNPAGEVVSEISGGISPDDLPAVADALTATLAGLGVLRRQNRKPIVPLLATAPEGQRRRHPNQGMRWSAEDDDRLTLRHREGASQKELVEEFGRSRGGITSRLEHLGLITPPEPSTSTGSGRWARLGRSAAPESPAGSESPAGPEGSVGAGSSAGFEGPVGLQGSAGQEGSGESKQAAAPAREREVVTEAA